MADLLNIIDRVGRFVWRVPSPAELQRWSDMEVLALHERRGRNPWVTDVVVAELDRRDDLARERRQVEERKRAARQRRLSAQTDYQCVVEAAYLAADAACKGNLVNREGQAKGIDGRWLFSGPAGYAMKYASYELADWWQSHPRLTFAEWKAGQRQARPEAI